jgi:hypothetical protein
MNSLKGKIMVIELLGNEYSIYRLDPEDIIDNRLFGKNFISITKTEDEISIVTVSGTLEHFEKEEGFWRMLKINGVLDFSLIGIISKISTLLANQGISVFVLSTYNTDYIMVKMDKIGSTINVLKQNGYEIKM